MKHNKVVISLLMCIDRCTDRQEDIQRDKCGYLFCCFVLFVCGFVDFFKPRDLLLRWTVL